MEEITPDMPYPKGKHVIITNFVDTGYAHNVESRQFVTGVLMFLNKTPIQWNSGCQNTAEISTYISELVVMLIFNELTMELC